MYNRLGTIPACDRQTDRQTSCHGIVRTMHTRRAVKTGNFMYASLMAATLSANEILHTQRDIQTAVKILASRNHRQRISAALL